jgi:KDO2-lipid IV(A) lauroyltransferase
VRTEKGWRLTLTPWTVADDLDNQACAEALNRAIELQIAQAPEQYLWAYNRYKIPKGQQSPTPSQEIEAS